MPSHVFKASYTITLCIQDSLGYTSLDSTLCCRSLLLTPQKSQSSQPLTTIRPSFSTKKSSSVTSCIAGHKGKEGRRCTTYPCAKFSTISGDKGFLISDITGCLPVVFHYKKYTLNQGQFLSEDQCHRLKLW